MSSRIPLPRIGGAAVSRPALAGRAFVAPALVAPVLVAVALVAASAAHASPVCTTSPEAAWVPRETMRQRIVDAGYDIAVFKTTDGNCYEIYGRDKTGRRVEIYFDPVSGQPVKVTVR